MIRVVKTLSAHLFFILLFAVFYSYFSTHFNNNHHRFNKINNYNSESKMKLSIVDFFLFSTTIQTGVGLTDILPISVYGKIFMIIQQLIMISINVITIFIFTR
jgi:hypothetical protein